LLNLPATKFFYKLLTKYDNCHTFVIFVGPITEPLDAPPGVGLDEVTKG
jgi:hypothetical protein